MKSTVPVTQEKNWRIDSMLMQTTTPSSTPGNGADDADRGTGHEEDAHDGAGRRAHGAQDGDVAALVLHQHDQAGDDVQRRDQNDQRQDHEHHIALHLQGGEERLVALAPIGDGDLTACRFLHLGAEIVDIVGIVGEELDRLNEALRR